MLKPSGQHPPPGPERSMGDLIEQVLDDALEYGRAELELLKARVQELVESYVRAAILVAVAAVLALAGIVVLFVFTDDTLITRCRGPLICTVSGSKCGRTIPVPGAATMSIPDGTTGTFRLHVGSKRSVSCLG